MATTQSLQPSQGRLLSLDAFRGFTIACMVLVNYPGTWEHVYGPLCHVEWNGLTPTDLIFPSFIFMVGVSIAFAYQKRLEAGNSRAQMRNKIIIRALKIYLVGMFLEVFGTVIHFFQHFSVSMHDPDKFVHLQHWLLYDIRYTGVLHRIAIVFLVCGLLFLYTKVRTQVWICALFLIGYFVVVMMIPTPGQGQVVFEPGNNIVSWVDSKLLPGKVWWSPDNPERDWNEWKSRNPNMQPWDPEGIISTFPAVSSALIGLFAGLLLLDKKRTQERKVMILFFAGALMLGSSYFANLVFPINKSMWTSSYVLFAAGFACTVLASSIYFMDILGFKRYAYIGIVFGGNAIAIYVLAALLDPLFYGEQGFNHIVMNSLTAMGTSAKFASMAFALIFVAVNFIPAWILYKLKIYIRL